MATGNSTPRPTVEVLLATFNGQRFLPELLDSLLGQSHRDFTILVSDDRSSDRTPAILRDYSDRFPGRILILPPPAQHLGAVGNFGRLLAHASADYVLTCDHDDVWLPDKIAVSLSQMIKLEASHPRGTPLLVHTDLIVAGPSLEVLDASFFRYTQIDPSRSDLISLLQSNVATGCASIINRRLYLRARPVPSYASMHDHWLAQVAAALGAVKYVEHSTILYRQHRGNLIGARKSGRASFQRRLHRLLLCDAQLQFLLRCSRQAAELLARYAQDMRPEERSAASALATLWTTSRWRRMGQLRRAGLLPRGIAGKIAVFLVVAQRSAAPEASAGATRRSRWLSLSSSPLSEAAPPGSANSERTRRAI